MDNELTEIIKSVCNSLNEEKVEYLILGGTAVAIYGHYRASTLSDGTISNKYDIDFWFNPTLSNVNNLIKALAKLGIDLSELTDTVIVPKKTYLRHEFEKFKVDFLPSIKGVENFSSAYRNKFIPDIDDVKINVISLTDLISNKNATGRTKDLEDVKILTLKKV
jgi:predicted nucleotidyltransferase